MQSTREAAFQDRLRDLILGIIRNARFDGIELAIERDYPIGNRRADLVLIDKASRRPVLIIETKRKYVEAGSFRTDTRLNPMSRAVIGQALCYAALARNAFNLPSTPLFATANPGGMVVFAPIERPEEFVDMDACREGRYDQALRPGKYSDLINKYRLDIVRITEGDLQAVIERAVKLWRGLIHPQTVQIGLTNWFIEYLRLGFVDALIDTYGVADFLRNELIRDGDYRGRLDRLARENGYRNGLSDIIGPNLENVENLARMMIYVLMNKIIFYKVLERSYQLRRLTPLCGGKITPIRQYLDALQQYFNEAIKVTNDFEPIFVTGLYDEVRLPDDPAVCGVIDDLIRTLNEVDILQFGDIIGYVYERVIPEDERHRLGQFYTPPAVAQLIIKWAVRSPSDRVLDPGVGSGTFLIEAYSRLFRLKTGKTLFETKPSKTVHEGILEQLWGVDINAFPLQLTAVNLAMRNVRAPSTKAKLIHADFFRLEPGQQYMAPWRSVGVEGRSGVIEIPKEFDAVVGNPPYTRWVEIPDNTQGAILHEFNRLFDVYDLRPDPRRGREPGIYVYWIMHATDYLRDGGRLGMIISNMWLQTDYGVEFGKFLLDNYKIKALIDLSYRLFEALISTVIILAEKASGKEREQERGNNNVLLIRVPPIDSKLSDRDVEKMLEGVLGCIADSIIEGSYEFDLNKLSKCQGIRYRVIRQSEIPRDRKWVGLFFTGVEDVVKRLEKLAEEGRLMIKAKEWFEPSYGNALYLCLTSWGLIRGVRNLGAREFFYFSEDEKANWRIPDECLAPAITRSQWVRTFTFTRDDWDNLRRAGRDVYLFMCHKPRNELPQEVRKYVEWGESDECRTRIRGTRGGGRRCSEAEACRAREGREARGIFHGWYDLGGYIPTPIMAIYQSGYKPRFFLTYFFVATYHAIITFTPKVKITYPFDFDPGVIVKGYPALRGLAREVKPGITLDEVEVKALMAYLNSTFNWLWLEQTGRRTGGGILALEVSIAREMPILNVKAIDREHVKRLAELFDELEGRARKLVDPSDDEEEVEEDRSSLNMIRALRDVFREVDRTIAEVLGMDVDVDALWDAAWDMMERRVKGAQRVARPGATPIPEEKPESKSGRGRRRRRGGNSADITSFFN